MSGERSAGKSPDDTGLTAAEWVLRHDRGLTAAEQDEFSQWLADPDHRAAWAEHRWGWDELDRLAGLQTSHHAVPDPDLLGRRKTRPLVPSLALSVAAAVALAVGVYFWPTAPRSPEAKPAAGVARTPVPLIERRELPDGSAITLNRGAVVEEHFTPGERRVALRRGEAHFTVAKDAARPFIVEVGGVVLRAVGTAFNVRLEPSAIDVLVTEGRVAIASSDRGGPEELRPAAMRGGLMISADVSRRPDPTPLIVSAGEKTVIALAPAAPATPEVLAVTPAEIEARLAWQPRLLDFTNAPLPQIVAEFNRCNPVRLVLGDPELATFRLSATFRSDNVEGFVRLMISDFGLRAERPGEGEIALFRAR